jgi:hypothetical protein
MPRSHRPHFILEDGRCRHSSFTREFAGCFDGIMQCLQNGVIFILTKWRAIVASWIDGDDNVARSRTNVV